MENNKQTAVNYLLSHIWTTDWVNYTREQKLAIIEQAKAMNKEEIIEGYANGHNDGCRYMNNEKQQFEHAEQYYEQTYGGGEQ